MDWTGASLDAFRLHRHDVQNALQLVRGYIQLNRPNNAIEVVDGLSAWLHSLTLISNLGPSASPWISQAAQCPHVVLTDLAGDSADQETYEMVADSWSWLNEACAEQAIRTIWAKVTLDGGRETNRERQKKGHPFIIRTQFDKHSALLWDSTEKVQEAAKRLIFLQE